MKTFSIFLNEEAPKVVEDFFKKHVLPKGEDVKEAINNESLSDLNVGFEFEVYLKVPFIDESKYEEKNKKETKSQLSHQTELGLLNKNFASNPERFINSAIAYKTLTDNIISWIKSVVKDYPSEVDGKDIKQDFEKNKPILEHYLNNVEKGNYNNNTDLESRGFNIQNIALDLLPATKPHTHINDVEEFLKEAKKQIENEKLDKDKTYLLVTEIEFYKKFMRHMKKISEIKKPTTPKLNTYFDKEKYFNTNLLVNGENNPLIVNAFHFYLKHKYNGSLNALLENRSFSKSESRSKKVGGTHKESFKNHNFIFYNELCEFLKAKGFNIEVHPDPRSPKDYKTTWYIVPDLSVSSNHPGWFAVEIVTPVMSFSTAEDQLKKFIDLLRERDVITDRSTGLHMSVSFSNPEKNKEISLLKLIVMTQDTLFSAEFSREFNTYCKSQLNVVESGIRQWVKQHKSQITPETVEEAKKFLNNIVLEIFKRKYTKNDPNKPKYYAINFTKFLNVDLKEVDEKKVSINQTGFVEYRFMGDDYLKPENLVKAIGTINWLARAFKMSASNEFDDQFHEWLYSESSKFFKNEE